jgi:hypothetical protein
LENLPGLDTDAFNLRPAGCRDRPAFRYTIDPSALFSNTAVTLFTSAQTLLSSALKQLTTIKKAHNMGFPGKAAPLTNYTKNDFSFKAPKNDAPLQKNLFHRHH